MEFKTMYCTGIVNQKNGNNFHDLIIEGKINDTVKDGKINYIAAAGPDRRATFTGSGLPFKDQIQAFDNTPNIGELQLTSGNRFTIPLITPNSYMVGLGSVQVPPTLYIYYTRSDGNENMISIKVSEPIPYRLLTYPTYPRPRIDASFYDTQFELIPKTQEQILYDSAYPSTRKTYENFWGKRPVN
jgi:hypothetical protein